jgi:hypothetical protein
MQVSVVHAEAEVDQAPLGKNRWMGSFECVAYLACRDDPIRIYVYLCQIQKVP